MKQTKLEVQLIEENGNIYNLLGIVNKKLRQNGFSDKPDQLWKEVRESTNFYEEALTIIQKYVIII